MSHEDTCWHQDQLLQHDSGCFHMLQMIAGPAHSQVACKLAVLAPEPKTKQLMVPSH